MALFATNTEAQERHLHRGDAGQRNLTPAEIEELNKSFDPFNDLGIQIKDGRPVYSNKVPRMFITAPNGEFQDGVKTLSELNIEYGSPEFWRHAQLGNVFVYPAGQQKPSQLQLSAKGKDVPTVSLSKPLDETKMPDRKIKKPNIFHRILQLIVPSFKERVKSYDNQGNSKTALYLSVRSDLNNRSEYDAKKELDQVASAKKYMEAKAIADKAYEENKHIREDYDKKYGPEDVRFDYVDRVYGLKYNATERMKDQEWASEENMKKLTDYSKDLKMNEVKNFGKQRFDNDDFSTIAYYTCLKPENLERNKKNVAEYDPGLEKGLINAGLSAEDAHEIAISHAKNNATTDIFDSDPARGKTGDLIIQNTLQPARKETKEAFLSYKAGNKKPLAGLVANAVKQAARSHGEMSESNPEKFGTMNSCILKQAGRLSELLEKDPELEKIAMKEYKMKEEDLKLVKGLGQYKKLDDARKEAKEKLSDAAIQGKPLDEDTKQKCIKDIVKADYVENMMLKDIKNVVDPDVAEQMKLKDPNVSVRTHSKKTAELTEKIRGNYDLLPRKGAPTAPGKINMSKGEDIIANELPGLFDSRSTLVSGISADSPALNAAADKIIAADKLYEKNMSPGKLYEKVMSGQYSTNAQNEAAKEIVKQSEKMHNNEPEKNGPTIGNRAKMFEDKNPQAGSPIA